MGQPPWASPLHDVRGVAQDVIFGTQLFELCVLKFSAMPSNELYLVVLPLIHIPSPVINRLISNVVRQPGPMEQVLTLFPDRDFATEFYSDEVQFYIDSFRANIRSLTGGHVTGYEIFTETTADGRIVVRVVQYVA